MPFIIHPYFTIAVLLLTGGYCLYTDLKERKIYDKITLPLLASGMVLSLAQAIYKQVITPGPVSFSQMLWHDWLKVPVICAVIFYVLFQLYVFAAGDLKFLVAISPWLGSAMLVMGWFLPITMIVWAILCLLKDANWNPLELIKRQWIMTRDGLVYLYKRLTKKECNPPDLTSQKVAGMPAIYAAMVWIFCIVIF